MEPPDILDLVASESVCPDTAVGWLWYCDEHDSHGNADSEDEARAVGRAHTSWHLGGKDGDACRVIVWQRTSHERVE